MNEEIEIAGIKTKSGLGCDTAEYPCVGAGVE